MKKRILSIVLAISMIFGMAAALSVSVSAETLTSGDYEYAILDDGTVEITKYTGSAEELEIPSEIDGKKVTGIDENAFNSHTSLTSITIPNGVTNIGESAFKDCTSLTSVTIPDSVTYIGDYAFSGCESLTSVTIPDSVISIGEVAFYGCTSLTSVTIPNGVTSIGMCAFDNCESLTSVTIADSVKSIGESAFRLTALYNNESNWENGVLYIDNCLILGKLFAYDEYDVEKEEFKTIAEVKGDYKIKSGTRLIADCAFLDCQSLTGITIPDSVTSIGKEAFENCESLTSVTISNSVTNIGDCAFDGCQSLTSVIIPDSVTSIGRWAFYDCTSLTSVTIPDSATSIDDYAFGYYYDNDEEGNKKISNFHINCYSGTTGEKYAINNGFEYTLLPASNEPNIIIENINGKLGAVEKTVNEDGSVTLTIKPNDKASFEKWSINGDYEIANGDLTSLTVTIKLNPGPVSVTPEFESEPDMKYGDANGDGKVTAADVLLIRKSIAGQNVKLNKTAADVNCDDKLTASDVLLIRKFIAGQKVQLGK